MRLPVNALGEPGAQILVVPHHGLPQTFTWDMIVAEQHWSAGRTHMSVLIQVEATLRLDEFRNPSPGLNRVTVMIERPN